jgi:hypothetical protein
LIDENILSAVVLDQHDKPIGFVDMMVRRMRFLSGGYPLRIVSLGFGDVHCGPVLHRHYRRNVSLAACALCSCPSPP